MGMAFADLAKQAGSDGVVTAAEVMALYREAWQDHVLTQDEAHALFALNAAIAEPRAEWADFFVTLVCEYLLSQRQPRNYVTDEDAAWLMREIDRDGRLDSAVELELLVRVFERALNAPASLKDYALHRIEAAVLSGEGPTRGGALEPGQINATEAGLLRRLLFAPASDRPAGIGRAEAELLFRLKDAALHADNAPEWKQLFVQGVANYLQGFASAAAEVTRERAAELEAFIADHSSSGVGFFRRFLSAKPDFAGYRKALYDRDQPFADREAQAEQGAAVTGEERDWLDARIAADGGVDHYEQALLDFLASED